MFCSPRFFVLFFWWYLVKRGSDLIFNFLSVSGKNPYFEVFRFSDLFLNDARHPNHQLSVSRVDWLLDPQE